MHKALSMDCLHRNRQHEGDLEQPLLQGAEKKEGASDSAAQNGHARSEISEAAGSEAEAAAAPSSRAQSVWRDPVVPATLAAVLCLWVLKLVQQGYVDGADTPLFILVCMLALHNSSPSQQQLLHCKHRLPCLCCLQGLLQCCGQEVISVSSAPCPSRA